MQCIVGLLTGSDVELQQEAAWCLTNISAGTHDHALLVAKAAAPYLVTFLTGSNPLLQVILSCQPRVTVMSCFVYSIFRNL